MCDDGIDCGDCDCGDCDCCSCDCDCCSGIADCCSGIADCCCSGGGVGDDNFCCCCICGGEPNYSGASRPYPYTNRRGDCCCSTKCCSIFITALFVIAVFTLIALLVVTFAVVFPARVTVEDAHLGRFALIHGANGTALAYDVSLTIAVRNRNFAKGAWRAAPLDAELRFRDQTFARARAQLESTEWGMSKARGKGLYRMTASSEENKGTPPVVLGGDGVVAEFVRESVAGVFELELVVAGGEVKTNEEHHHGKDGTGSVRVICPLKLSLPTPTAPFVAFTRVKCK